MNPVNLAVILLSPLSTGYRLLLHKDMAGIALLKRLVLTLQRAGLNDILIISNGLMEKKKQQTENSFEKDSRFKGNLLWIDQNEILAEEGWQRVKTFADRQSFLLVGGNIVTTAKTIKDFIHETRVAGIPDRKTISGFRPGPELPGGMHLFPEEKPEMLQHLVRHKAIEEPVEPIHLTDESYFLKEVEDVESARKVEQELIQNHKHHYSQTMDVMFNSRFSLPISALLVKTPLSPNQITLMGLLIGLAAGWFFSHGTYLAGLLGGILLAGTAIWDCCDGDVARLKLMESDFGETLDTICDNIINVFIFTGMMIGVSKTHGMIHALIPFSLLAIGGTLIFVLIYFPRGGKGSFFKGTWMYEVIQVLASRNFIYVILLFAIFGRVDWFLWSAGVGSIFFTLALFMAKRKILRSETEYPKNQGHL